MILVKQSFTMRPKKMQSQICYNLKVQISVFIVQCSSTFNILSCHSCRIIKRKSSHYTAFPKKVKVIPEIILQLVITGNTSF